MATLKNVSQSIRKGDWAATMWGTLYSWKSTEASFPLCSWSRNRTGCRSFINLRGLNSYTKKRDFMMATLKDVSQSIRKGDWTVDFSHQYSLRHCRPGWIPAKLEEMSSATQTEVRILVPAVGLKGIASDASGGQDFCRLGSLSNQTFLGSCGSNTSSCPSDTGKNGDRILCFVLNGEARESVKWWTDSKRGGGPREVESVF